MQAQCQQTMKANLIFLFLIANLIAGCATSSNPVANMPAWMGGLPADAGTPAYEAWQAERAKEAARLKTQ